VKNKKTLYYIASGIAVLALGAALLIILNSARNKEFISSTEIESVRARNAYDPDNAEEITDEAELLRLLEHFNSLELKKAEEPPQDDENGDGMLSIEFFYKNGKRTTVYQLGERYLRLEGGDWMEITGEDADGLDSLLDSAKYASLKKCFPEYFDLGLGRGLDVFAWKKDGEFVYGIAPMASIYEAGKYPVTSLASLSEKEMLLVLGSYSSQEVSSLIFAGCLLENEQGNLAYKTMEQEPSVSSSVPASVFDSSLSDITWIGGEGDGLSWSSSSIWFEATVETDLSKYERNCVRLVPILEIEASNTEYEQLKSLFESSIAPLFKPYERPAVDVDIWFD
jgi:hypothetical protein